VQVATARADDERDETVDLLRRSEAANSEIAGQTLGGGDLLEQSGAPCGERDPAP